MFTHHRIPIFIGMIGVLLGLLQTGLFFNLTFTLSSGFRTYLMVTVCWLLGSFLGTTYLSRISLPLFWLLLLAWSAYTTVYVLLQGFPYNASLWFVYAVLCFLIGIYPGVFFAHMPQYVTVRQLFFWENNGFIIGFAIGTLLFILYGRASLWWAPFVLVVISVFQQRHILNSTHQSKTLD
jgi:hypothetical protein